MKMYIFFIIIVVFAYFWTNPPKVVFWKTDWWKRHICAPFPYRPQCFDCGRPTCKYCPHNK